MATSEPSIEKLPAGTYTQCEYRYASSGRRCNRPVAQRYDGMALCWQQHAPTVRSVAGEVAAERQAEREARLGTAFDAIRAALGYTDAQVAQYMARSAAHVSLTVEAAERVGELLARPADESVFVETVVAAQLIGPYVAPHWVIETVGEVSDADDLAAINAGGWTVLGRDIRGWAVPQTSTEYTYVISVPNGFGHHAHYLALVATKRM